MIKDCNCIREYQDKIYGKGKRVHNEKKPKNAGTKEYRCTVCGKDK